MKYSSEILKAIALGVCAALTATLAPVQAQSGSDATVGLEEIVVTGRKREENLIDVPVSISVWSAEGLADQGIMNQETLFEATVGLDFSNYNGQRSQNNPGIRGVQSQLRAANQQKVTSFIDGMPTSGNQGTLNFSGIDAVEVYRGPQSAAFGRATFAGAINYVTSDATEEFTGKVMAQVSSLGATEGGVLLSGPIGDKLGYRVSYTKQEFQGPDNWTATDGQKLGSEDGSILRAKLNFEFSDTAYGEINYTRNKSTDMQGAITSIDPSTCGHVGASVYRFSMGTDFQLPDGAWDCARLSADGSIGRNSNVLSDFLSTYDANIAAYTMAAPMADTNMNGSVSSAEYLAQTFADGQTYEQALLGQTVDPFFETVRDRVTAEMNFEIGDNLLQVMGMYADERMDSWFEADNSGTQAVFAVNMMTMRVALGTNIMSMGMFGNTEEKYAEVRWISSDQEKLRYTLAGSYYNYDLSNQIYNNYGAIARNLLLPSGAQVNSQTGITISEVATNMGLSFGVQYDISDNTTLSLESRYQSDEVCGQDKRGANVKSCKDTKSFLPRLAITHSINDNVSVYGQASYGNNPAGVNIAYADPGNIQALQVASGQIVSPWDGYTYNGADGVHFSTIDYDETTFADYEEETLTNFEIGTKGSFADGRGSFTAALYYMKYKNMVGAENLDWDNLDPNGWNEGNYSNFTGERSWINQGDGEMYGVEIDTNFAVNEIWQVGGYLTLSSAKFTDYCSIQAPQYRTAAGGPTGGGANTLAIQTPTTHGVPSSCGVVNGNWLPKQSPFSGNLNISATLPNDVFGLRTSIRLDLRAKGSYYEDHLNLLERKPVTTVNMSANMRNETWNVRIFVNNLTDLDEPVRVAGVNYWENNSNVLRTPATNGSYYYVPRRPREIGLLVGYNF
jgi:iron complex outermembrane receptor protein